MNVYILGGLKRLEKEYKSVGKKHGCKTRVLNTHCTNCNKCLKDSDAVIFMVDNASHKMVQSAKQTCKKNNIPMIFTDKASVTSLDNVISCMANRKNNLKACSI